MIAAARSKIHFKVSSLHYRYCKKGPQKRLTISKDLIEVRSHDGRPVIVDYEPAKWWTAATRNELQGAKPLFAEPYLGVQILRVPEADLEKYRSTVEEANVRSVKSVLVEEDGGWASFTKNGYVEFFPGTPEGDCHAVFEAYGLQIKRRLAVAPKAWLVSAPEKTSLNGVFEISNDILDRPQVVHSYPELVRGSGLRSIYERQWHLKKTSFDNEEYDGHINVEEAWDATRGEGATIAIIDKGFWGLLTHREFQDFGKVVHPVTIQGNEVRPGRLNDHSHGTHSAGLACAAGKAGPLWASGAAPDAKLMPICISMGPSLQSVEEIHAFTWAADHGADVISCGWGPQDGRPGPVELPPLTRKAIDYAADKGRNGKGCVVVFAAGNGGKANENVDDDVYASYPKVMAVGACNAHEERCPYSECGAALWCCAPSGDPDGNLPGLWTTDPSGKAGDITAQAPDWDYFGGFSKTSASAAIAAGVAALVLSTNPHLCWHEVKEIIAGSCRKIGGPYTHGRNDCLGYGRIDALEAVRQASRLKKIL